MLRKRISIIPAVVAAAALFSFTGCPKVFRSNTIAVVDVKPEAKTTITLVDLDVSDKKVVGVDSGRIIPGITTKEGIIRSAVANAIAKHEGADALVGYTVFTETRRHWFKAIVKATVVGYPARYKNFRSKEESDDDKRPASMVIDHRVSRKDGGPEHRRKDVGPENRAGSQDVPVIVPVPAAAATEE